jgi:VWFA-related protein
MRIIYAIAAGCAIAAETLVSSAAPCLAETTPRRIAVVATVTDRDHHVVSGLTPADFEILVDGKPRPLAGFDPARRPLSVTVIVDRSESLSLGPAGVRAAAARFLADLLPVDEARVCGFTGQIVCSAQFTTDHAELASDVTHLKTGFGSRLYDTVSAMLEATQQVPANRRRLIVIFSDGEDNGSRTRFREVIARARADEVMIYGIGLETRFDDGDDFVSSRPDLTLMPLAAETGGGYYEPGRSKDLMDIVARIEDELRHQYVLTFVPASTDNRIHRIHLRMTQPDLHVRARQRVSLPSR